MTFQLRKRKDVHSNRMSNDFISSYIHESMQYIKDVLLLLQQSPTDISVASTIPSTTQAIEDMTDFDEYKHVVALLCAIEGVLHRVRDAELRPKTELIALLLICCDHVSRMVRQFANRDEIYLGYLKRSHGLIRQLRAYHRNKFEHGAAA